MIALRAPFLALVVAVAIGGCSSSSSSSGGPAQNFIAGFSPPAVAAGFTRYVGPPVHGIAGGTDVTFCQWLADASTVDKDALKVTGVQSKYGHHVVLYATTIAETVGTSRECTGDDMLSVRYVGAIGGEGTGGIGTLPDGVAIRLQKGEHVMANVHFINTGAAAIDGQAAIDIEWADPSPDRQIAAFFTNVATKFSVPAHGTFTQDLNCTSQLDMPMILAANHMHTHGTAALTEIVHADGTKEMVVEDKTWSGEQQFNPHFVSFPVAQPFMVHKGDVVHSTCTWMNDTSTAIAFPTEMCAGFAFYLAPKGTVGQEIHCIDNAWPTP